MQQIKDDLIKTLEEYIKLLDKECSRLGTQMIVRPYLAPSEEDVELGKQLRDKISELKNKLNNEFN